MGEFNDGKAYAFSNTGEFRLIIEDSLAKSNSIVRRGIETTIYPLSITRPEAHASVKTDPIFSHGVDIKQYLESKNSQARQRKSFKVFLDTGNVKVDVIDTGTFDNTISAKTAYVSSEMYDYAYVMPFVKPLRIRKQKPTNSWYRRGSYKITNGTALSSNSFHVVKATPLNFVTAQVFESRQQINFITGRSVVSNKKVINPGSNVLMPISVSVEDYKPPVIGQTGSGSGVNSVKYVFQKFSFAEVYISFDDCKVLTVQGLPEGMYVENSFVKGSPTVSGTYPIQFKLDNSRILEGLIIVPNVPRQL
jgi:hypothetical protein